MLRPAPVALLVVAEIPRLAGVYEPTAVRACAADGARGDSWRPALAELAVARAIAAFGGAAALEVALALVDVALVAAVAIAFLASAIFFPGVATVMIALGGILVLGYYNSYVRHDPAKDHEGLRGKPRMDHHDTLRAAWR
jgi:hypothetical protein